MNAYRQSRVISQSCLVSCRLSLVESSPFQSHFPVAQPSSLHSPAPSMSNSSGATSATLAIPAEAPRATFGSSHHNTHTTLRTAVALIITYWFSHTNCRPGFPESRLRPHRMFSHLSCPRLLPWGFIAGWARRCRSSLILRYGRKAYRATEQG